MYSRIGVVAKAVAVSQECQQRRKVVRLELGVEKSCMLHQAELAPF
jgi:hypothetical protein